MRRLVLTKIAQDRLYDIVDWTIETFGPRQATAYEGELVSVLSRIVNETALTQDCALLMEEGSVTPLKFARAGKHLIIFMEFDVRFVVVDLLHSSSDLAAHLDRLTNMATDLDSD